MELLFVVLGGIILGAIARYTMRNREFHGAALMPAVGGVSATVLWIGLTWAGLAWDGGWIWVITFVGTAIVVAVVDAAVGVLRKRGDVTRLVALRKAV